MLIHCGGFFALGAENNKRPCGRLLSFVCPDGIVNKLTFVGLLT